MLKYINKPVHIQHKINYVKPVIKHPWIKFFQNDEKKDISKQKQKQNKSVIKSSETN